MDKKSGRTISEENITNANQQKYKCVKIFIKKFKINLKLFLKLKLKIEREDRIQRYDSDFKRE